MFAAIFPQRSPKRKQIFNKFLQESVANGQMMASVKTNLIVGYILRHLGEG